VHTKPFLYYCNALLISVCAIFFSILKLICRLAAPAERRGGFGTFGWAMWAAGMTRNSSRLAAPRATTSWASNSKSPPAAFSTRRLTRKPPGNMRQLIHQMLSPGGPGYDRGRLTPVPGPGADNHDSPNALLLPHLLRAP
jgi:hypothetical protein